MSDQIKPRVAGYVPWCSHGECRHDCADYPGCAGVQICRPAIRAMALDAALGRRVRAMPPGWKLFQDEHGRGYVDGCERDVFEGEGETMDAALVAAGVEGKQ
jgi:hypothetical protein